MSDINLAHRLRIKRRSNSKDYTGTSVLTLKPKLKQQLNLSLKQANAVAKPASKYIQSVCTLANQPSTINNFFKRSNSIAKLPPIVQHRRSISWAEAEHDDLSQLTDVLDLIKNLEGSEIQVENFWYCNRREEFYDFEFVQFNNRNPREYLTISMRGVTHMQDEKATFYSLRTWLEECKMFNKLKEIRFFNKFRLQKNFALWKIIRRRRMIFETTMKVSEDYIFLNSHFQRAFWKIRELTFKISNMKLLDVKLTKVRTLKKYLENQDRCRKKLTSSLVEMEKSIKKIILNMSAESTEGANEKSQLPKTRSEKAMRQMPYTEQAVVRSFYLQLCKFIRFCDFAIIQTKSEHAFESISKLLTYFNGKLYFKRKCGSMDLIPYQPILHVKAELSDLSITLNPKLEQIKSGIQSSIKKTVYALLNNKLLFESSEFANFKRLSLIGREKIEESNNYVEIVLNHSIVTKVVAQINNILDSKYSLIESQANTLRHFIDVYKMNRRFQVKTLARKTILQIKMTLMGFKQQIEEMTAIQEINDFEFLRLDLGPVKEVLLPSPKNCLHEIENFLPEFTYQTALELKGEVRAQNSVAIGTCHTVEAFVNQQSFFKDLEVILPDLHARMIELKELLLLLEDFHFSHTVNLGNVFYGIGAGVDILDKKLNYFFEREEKEKAKFSKKLKEDILGVNDRCTEIRKVLSDYKLNSIEASPTEAVIFLDSLQITIKELQEDCFNFNCWEVELGMDPSKFTSMNTLSKDFSLMMEMWKTLRSWNIKMIDWKNTPLGEIDVDEYVNDVTNHYRIAIDSKKLENQGNSVPSHLLGKLSSFVDSLPLIEKLRSPELQESHWEQIGHLAGRKLAFRSSKFTLETILSLDLQRHLDEISVIALKAKKEREIDSSLDNVVRQWQTIDLNIEYDKLNDTYYLLETEDLSLKLDESLVTLGTLLNNKYVGPILEAVEECYASFKIFAEVFEMWQRCHKMWQDLGKIFQNSDVSSKLKDNSRAFNMVDFFYREKLRQVIDRPNALKACTGPSALGDFRDWIRSLEKLQRSIEFHLDEQRVLFPRYFFLSNEELLMITSTGQDPRNVQKFFGNMFQNVQELQFDPDRPDSVQFLLSHEREPLWMPPSTKTKGSVEEWLRVLENAMVNSLRRLTNEAARDYRQKPKKDFLLEFPTQVVCCVEMLEFTNSVESLLSTEMSVGAMQDLYDSIYYFVDDLTVLIREDNLHYVIRRLATLIGQQIHSRDIVEMLRDELVSEVSDYRWQMQLRYYWDFAADGMQIRQLQTAYGYCYEFLGAALRLVNTPLTDRCWLTLSTAFKLNMGAAVTGPAGTGKTESIKDLAKSIGKYCVMFNCSEQMSIATVNKVIAGLCYTGAWSCFDEFNRIDIEVLSLIAQQIRAVKRAKDQMKDEISIDDIRARLNHSLGIFVTMNLNYEGRTTLPDNLKVLLRPMTMTLPDKNLIIEVILNSEGFLESKSLSNKVVRFLELANEQLSQQRFYDFGLRAVISSLLLAGEFRRKNMQLTEDEVIVRILKQSSIGRLIDGDLLLFFRLLQDVFPETDLQKEENLDLKNALKEYMISKNLSSTDEVLEKIVQIYTIALVRYGVMIIGDAACGKSTCLSILLETLETLWEQGNTDYRQVFYNKINPKSITVGNLFGEVNSDSNEWVEGEAVKIMKFQARMKEEEHAWIIFDGPVDTIWIENLNSVLDDNRMLCLANQERVKIRKNQKVIIETDNLNHASPASISRCGVVYINNKVVRQTAIFEQFASKHLAGLPEPVLEHLRFLIRSYLGQAIKHRKVHTPLVPTTKQSLVSGFCALLLGCLKPVMNVFGTFDQDKEKRLIDKLFVYSLIWGISAGLPSSTLGQYEHSLSQMITLDLPRGNIFDFYVNTSKPGGEYKNWEYLVGNFIYSPSQSFYDIFVPTRDSVRIPAVMRCCISSEKPIFVTGNSGMGKTDLVKRFLNRLSSEDGYYIVREVFTAGTSVNEVNRFLDSKLEPKRGTLEAPHGANGIIFIDDVNLPKLNEWDSQPVIELLRGLLEHGEVIDMEKQRSVKILKTSYICCAAPAVGGRHPTSLRFNRHFHLITVPDLPEENILNIFRSIMDGFFRPFVRDISSFNNTFVAASVFIFSSCCETLKPTPSKSFYNFSFKDIQRVFQGLLRATPKTYTTADAFIRLWVHENMRVYYDRLLSEDRAWFIDLMLRTMNQYFRRTYSASELVGEESIIFYDFHKSSDMPGYKQIIDLDNTIFNIRNLILKKDMNIMNDIILFKEAAIHICKITRIFGVERGHALIIGSSGVGKKTIVKLAALVAELPLRSVTITKTYDAVALREDIKNLYLDFAHERTSNVVFMLSEDQIIDESFLEDINTMLSSISIANMFNKEDIEILTQNLHHLVTENSEYSNVYECFVERIRKHLRIVLCFRLNHEKLFKRLRNFPSLSSSCNIILLDTWSPESLVTVAQNKISYINEHSSKVSSLIVHSYQELVSLSQQFYNEQHIRVFVTPRTYLSMIADFCHIQEKYERERESIRIKIKKGCDQISKSKSEILTMEVNLQNLVPRLEEKMQETEELTKVLEADTLKANIEKDRLEEEEQEVNRATEKYKVMRKEAELELKQAYPVLEDAVKALNKLSPSDISEIRTFSTPPPLTLYTLEAIAILFEKPQSWDAIKKILQTNFLDKLKNFDRKSIKPGTLSKLKKKISKNPNFTPEQVGQHNVASKSLCKWVFAIENYTRVSQEFKPLKATLQKMNAELKASQTKLRSAQAKLKAEFNNVKKLEETFQENLRQKQELDEDIKMSKIRIERAFALIGSLKEEYTRWETLLQNMHDESKYYLGNAFLSAACVSYYGPFTYEFRKKLLESWKSSCKINSVLAHPEFNLLDTICKPSQIRAWNIFSLPMDTFSTTNAVLVTHSQRVPLIYDPQHQAIKWLKNMESDKGLIIVKETEKSFWSLLEASIQSGCPMIIKDVKQSLNPLLDTLVDDYSQKKSSITLGKNAVPVHYNFKLYLLSSAGSLSFSPDLYNKTNVINFQATSEALEEQLLIEVIKLLEPRLEEVKNKLIVELAETRNELDKLEETILQSLANTEINILDDPNIVPELERVKSVVIDINKRIEYSENNQQENESARDKYRPIAERGSLLYFSISDLSKINCMYHFSLLKFIEIFCGVIQSTRKLKQVDYYIQEVTKTIVNHVSMGLYNSHKHTFLFLVSVQLLIKQEKLTEEEWLIFVRGDSIATFFPISKNLNPSVFSDSMWRTLNLIEAVCPVYAKLKLLRDLSLNPQKWLDWVQSENPHTDFLSGYENLSTFHKLLLLKEARPEKMSYLVIDLIKEGIGEEYLQQPSILIKNIATEISNRTYTVFLLSKGDDPMSVIYSLIHHYSLPDKVETITMGKGQDIKAKHTIKKGSQQGSWVVLENCHLSNTMLKELEQIVSVLLDQQTVHKDFRLFLTSFPTPDFPSYVLQNGFKLTIEQPKGVRSMLKKSIETLASENPGLKDETFLRVAFCTSMYHGVVNERKKYGARSWATSYEFNHSDLDTSLKLLAKMNLSVSGVSGVRKLLADVVYGGRVNFLMDRKHLWALSSKFLPDESLTSSVSFTSSGEYCIPKEVSVASFLDYARHLPYLEEPELYGLDSNAQITADIEQSSVFLNSLAELAPLRKLQSIKGTRPEEFLLKHISYLMDVLPTPLKSTPLKKFLQKNKDYSALKIFFLQESERYDRLIRTVSQTFKQLKMANLGLVPMSFEYEVISESISLNEIPAKWKKFDPGNGQSLSRWVTSLKERVEFLKMCLSFRPKSYWLGAFLYPTGFFSAILQTFSRTFKFPIEVISFSFDFYDTIEDIEDYSEDSYYVHGLFMEGCSWDPETKVLADSLPGKIFSPAPIILFEPIDNHYVEPEDYIMPLYKSSNREGTFLLNVECPSKMSPEYWILRGAALFCRVNDK